ncbi:MAG: hypothetical protein ACRD30_09995 [Bryobacteraceae bacterium]
MAVNNPRSRTVIFRLTQEEYDALQSASSGALSLSEFARARLLASVSTPPLTDRIRELDSKVARLTELLEKS